MGWSKLEKVNAQMSIGFVVLFSFNGFGPKQLVHVFTKLIELISKYHISLSLNQWSSTFFVCGPLWHYVELWRAALIQLQLC